jgi:hypothetical protein
VSSGPGCFVDLSLEYLLKLLLLEFGHPRDYALDVGLQIAGRNHDQATSRLVEQLDLRPGS